MAQRVEIATVTCPVNTPVATPLETDISFGPGEVSSVFVRIPPGHAFLTGLQLGQGHQQIIPFTGTAWILGDDDRYEYNIEGFGNSGNWQAFTYNLDTVHPHTWQITFHVAELAVRSSLRRVTPLPVSAIHAAATRASVKRAG